MIMHVAILNFKKSLNFLKIYKIKTFLCAHHSFTYPVIYFTIYLALYSCRQGIYNYSVPTLAYAQNVF